MSGFWPFEENYQEYICCCLAEKISDVQIEKWLGNFSGRYFESVESEKKLALWLLAHFTYYTYDDVRILYRNIFNQYLHEKLYGYKGDNLARISYQKVVARLIGNEIIEILYI